MTICLPREICENSERMITRSVSRQMREKSGSDCGRAAENSQVAVDLFNLSESEFKNRGAVHSAGQMRGTSCDTVKVRNASPQVWRRRRSQQPVNHEKDGEVRECQQGAANSKRIIVLGLCVPMVLRQSTCTSASLLVRNEESSEVKKKKSEIGVSNCLGNHNESQKRMMRSSCAAISLNHEKGGKSDDFRQIMRNSDRVATRSSSKSLQGKTDICRQMLERERSHTSSMVPTRKEEFPQAKEKLENQMQKRMTCSLVASFSVIHEKDDKGDRCQQFLGNSDRMITSSASKTLHEKIDFPGQLSEVLARKAQKKKELENTNLVKCRGNQYQSQKRMTRSSSASSSINPQKNGEKDECPPNVGNRLISCSAPEAMQQKTNLIGQMVEKQYRRTSSRLSERKAESPKAKKQKLENTGVLSDTHVNQPQKRITRRLDSELDEVGCDLIAVRSSLCGVAVRKSRDEIDEEPKLIGVVRNRGQTMLQGTNQGWTKDQEAALQNAFFTAKPSPHFWKKVAKLVPGKTAQQCFDKMNSNIQTPPSTQPSSRVRKRDSPSVVSSPASKLIKSVGKKSRKTHKTKQKSHIAHRNARHLLQKYRHVNQNSEADLFSVLEPTVNPSTENKTLSSNQSLSGSKFSSAEKRSKKTGRSKQKSHVTSTNKRNLLLTNGHVDQDSEPDLPLVLDPALIFSGEPYRCNLPQSTPTNKLVSPGSSSLTHKKRLSRFSGVSVTPLTSPPVLKKVKNLALHEKYIDQLHMREAKRKMASARYSTAMCVQKNEEENPVAAIDVIKAAKDALCSDAKDAIRKFQQSLGNLMGTCSDSEELFCSDEDEVEEITPFVPK